MAYVISIDGMLSGTGIRDRQNGGYLDPHELGLSEALVRDIEQWVASYEDAHFDGFSDEAQNELLDKRGIELARRVRAEMPGSDVDYYSSASMRHILI